MLRASLAVHTISGLLAVVGWAVALLTHRQPLGLVALLAWWLATVSGLLLLGRWMPSRGRHVSGSAGDGWTVRHRTSIAAHVVVLIAATAFTLLVAR